MTAKPADPAPRAAVALRLVRSLDAIAAVARYGAQSPEIAESLAAAEIIARDSQALVRELREVR